MRWTNPRLLADRHEWYSASLDNDGPCCYEIGTGGSRGGRIQWHYVGETVNERKRISTYGRSGSHLAKTIDNHLRRGWLIYYRAVICESKTHAKRLQDNLLRSFRYDWNRIGNS